MGSNDHPDREDLFMTAESVLHTPEKGHVVIVTIDNTKKEIHRGDYIVSDLKVILGVPPQKELDIIKDGNLDPLADNAHIEIRGGEVFVSVIHTGGSS